MKLPGEKTTECVESLPCTPSNRNNLIGWIAGRSDDPNYGTAVVYDFPKTKLVDGPLQIEARIDQNAQLSGQLSLWNQQGSHVRRGSLIVIPIGRALLYAEPIYLQAERSPMPELRVVVLALQDRLAYGPSFESAMAALFGGAESSLSPTSGGAAATPRTAAPSTAAQPPKSVPAPPDVARPPADAMKSASGLAWRVLKPGTGATHPTPDELVTSHFTAWTTDGKTIETSSGGKAAVFQLEKVVPGLVEG